MIYPEVPDAEASAHGGWQVRVAQPEPIPPEVLDLFAAGSFMLLEQYALMAAADGGPGTVALSLPALGAARRAVLVVLRESQCPEVVYASEAAGGELAFRITAGKRDADARLLLLAVRSESAGPDPTGLGGIAVTSTTTSASPGIRFPSGRDEPVRDDAEH